MTQAIPLLRALPHGELPPIAAVSPCDGWDDVRGVVCGDSHARALCDAIAADASGLALRLGLAGLCGRLEAHAHYEAALPAITGRDVAVVWRGNQHTRDFLALAPPAFDFIPQSEPDAPLLPGAVVVPEAAIREHFAASLPGLDGFLGVARQLGARRLFVLGTAPPLADNQTIRRWALAHRVLVQAAAARGLDLATAPITPAPVRRKLWRVLQDMMADIAARQGAAFIAAPAGALDVTGCLRPALSAGDATHANAGYGAMLLAALARQMQAADATGIAP